MTLSKKICMLEDWRLWVRIEINYLVISNWFLFLLIITILKIKYYTKRILQKI